MQGYIVCFSLVVTKTNLSVHEDRNRVPFVKVRHGYTVHENLKTLHNVGKVVDMYVQFVLLITIYLVSSMTTNPIHSEHVVNR